MEHSAEDPGIVIEGSGLGDAIAIPITSLEDLQGIDLPVLVEKINTAKEIAEATLHSATHSAFYPDEQYRDEEEMIEILIAELGDEWTDDRIAGFLLWEEWTTRNNHVMRAALERTGRIESLEESG